MKLRSILNTVFPFCGNIVISQLILVKANGIDWEETSLVYTNRQDWFQS